MNILLILTLVLAFSILFGIIRRVVGSKYIPYILLGLMIGMVTSTYTENKELFCKYNPAVSECVKFEETKNKWYWIKTFNGESDE